MSDTGFGHGDGHGFGHGFGTGYGAGAGAGDGDGTGYGYGYGTGTGHGDGYGYGYGYGDGDGEGYGDGDGYGTGDGYGDNPRRRTMNGKIVLIRDHRAGIHVGRLEAFDGPTKTATLLDARKVWYWAGAASCHGIAARGLNHERSRVCPVVARVELLDVVEVVACSDEGAASVMECPEWRP